MLRVTARTASNVALNGMRVMSAAADVFKPTDTFARRHLGPSSEDQVRTYGVQLLCLLPAQCILFASQPPVLTLLLCLFLSL